MHPMQVRVVWSHSELTENKPKVQSTTFVYICRHFRPFTVTSHPSSEPNSTTSVSSMRSDKDSVVSGQSPKYRKGKTREVSSRFLSLSSTTPLETGSVSPREGLSPVRRKSGSNSTDTGNPGFIRGQLWPSSSPAASSTKKNLGATLADHLGNDRLREFLDRKKEGKSEKTSLVFSLSKQRSCREFGRFENDDDDDNNNNNNNSSKENHRPIGGSSRYTGKIGFPGKSSSSSVKPNSGSGSVPGSISMDENALYSKLLSPRRDSDSFAIILDSESDYSDARSGTDYFNSPAIGRSLMSSKKLGIEVPTKHTNDVSRRTRRGTSDSNIPNSLSSDDSSMLKKFTIKNAIRRANSLTGYKSSKSQWALSPGRSGSPPMSVESKEKLMSFSSLKPPTSPSKVKGVDKFLNMGFDLFKSKKSSMNMSPMGFGNSEVVHHLRVLDNRLIQWRYANARAEAVNRSISDQAESNLLYSWDGIKKLQHSVLQKKIQYEKEKFEMKLNFVVYSQIKLLEAWGDLERQHVSAITATKDCLHSVVCRVPLVEGGKVDLQSASIALRLASDLTASIKSMFTSFSRSADKTAALLSELAEVVAQEKLLLEEFHDLFQTISILEFQERSLKCGLIQHEGWQERQN